MGRSHWSSRETQRSHWSATRARRYALTVVTTIFIPAEFLTGVFGMNFSDMPELHWRWGYPLFWGLCFGSWVILFVLFRRTGFM